MAEFVTENMKMLMSEIGLEMTDDGGDVTLNGSVSKFIVVETNTYQANVSLKIKLQTADGETLWSGGE